MDLDIRIKEWDYTCAEGCCTYWGKDIFVNDQKLELENPDPSEKEILEGVLKFLGYTEVNITSEYE